MVQIKRRGMLAFHLQSLLGICFLTIQIMIYKGERENKDADSN